MDVQRAKQMYQASVQADPDHANNLSNYGLFLSDVEQNYGQAESM